MAATDLTDRTRQRLAEETIAWLATSRPQGEPHLTPLWFVFRDDCLWFAIGAGSVKVRNLRIRSAVSVALESGDDPVVAEGTAQVLAHPFPPTIVDAFREKYRWDLDDQVDPDLGVVVLVRVSIDRWLFGGAVSA